MPTLRRPAAETGPRGIVDPTRWQAFVPRDGDIVVNTPPKSGTTWTQGILAMLIAGDPQVDADHTMKAPWIDIAMRDVSEVMERLEAQTHRRQVKSHTRFDELPIWDGLRYLAVYRHPIDVHFSFRTHERNYRPDKMEVFYPDDVEESFALFLEQDTLMNVCLNAIVAHYRATLALEPWEGLLRLHYDDMKRDRAGHVARIAEHVGISHPPDVMEAIVDACGFDAMQANASHFAPEVAEDLWRSAAGFFASGTSRKWEGKLSEASLAAYDARLADLLPDPDERAWLEWGAAGA